MRAAARSQAKLLEHNVRFGDPECQCLMMRLESDLLAALLDAAGGSLAGTRLQWAAAPALTVVMAANGYPGAYEKGTPIGGIDAVRSAKVRWRAAPAADALHPERSRARRRAGLPCWHQVGERQRPRGQRRPSAGRLRDGGECARGKGAGVSGVPSAVGKHGIMKVVPPPAPTQLMLRQAVDCIRWPQGFCRRDIGWRAVLREDDAAV